MFCEENRLKNANLALNAYISEQHRLNAVVKSLHKKLSSFTGDIIFCGMFTDMGKAGLKVESLKPR